MPVQLQPSPMRFPTPRAINRRTPEPDFVETIAPLLPFATEGLLGLIRGGDAPPTAADRDEYLKENILYLGEDEEPDKTTPLTAVQQAKLDAYDIYGEPDEGGADWGSILANLVVGSQMGRGAGDYADTAIALKKAARTKEAATETARAVFLKERTKLEDKNITMVDLEASRLGEPQYRRAKTRKVGGGKLTYLLHDPDGDFGTPDAEGYVVAPQHWVDPTQMGENWQVSSIKDPALIELYKKIEEGMVRDADTSSMLSIINKQLGILQRDINDPKVTYTTFTSDLMNIGNSALAEAQSIMSLRGGGDYRTMFSADEGGGNIKGDGTASLNAFAELQQLMNLPQNARTDAEIEKILARLEQTADIDGLTLEGRGTFSSGDSWIKDILGDSAYGNVRVRANFLQLAYMAAASSGQTGRTLSDKDLAFFLEMVGANASSDVGLLHDNLLAFADIQIDSNEAKMRSTLGLNALAQYGLGEERNKAARNQVGMYYSVGKDLDGNEDWDTLTIENYKYKNFYDRHFDSPPIIEFYNRKPVRPDRYVRPFTSKGTPTDITGQGATLYDEEFLKRLKEGPK
jgi:hypothetical protein